MSSTSQAKLARGLSDFESRHLQVAAEVHVGIPLQLRIMREAKGWSQTELAEKVGTTQNSISRLESSSYGKPNVKTLLRLAEAFDVGLLVKFIPFSHFVRTIDEMSETSVAVPSYGDDKDLRSMESAPTSHGSLIELPVAQTDFSDTDQLNKADDYQGSTLAASILQRREITASTVEMIAGG